MAVTPIEGKDVAQLLGLQAYKWKVSLPKKANTMVLWAEEWRKGAKQPKIHHFFTSSVRGLASPSSFLLKLPDSANPQFVSVFQGGTASSSAPLLVIDGSKGGWGGDSASDQLLTLDNDTTLAHFVQNKSSSHYVSDKLSDIMKNDRTIFYKMRLTSRSSVMPIWKNGHVVLTNP